LGVFGGVRSRLQSDDYVMFWFWFTFLTLSTYAINEEMRMRGYETRDGRKMYMKAMEWKWNQRRL